MLADRFISLGTCAGSGYSSDRSPKLTLSPDLPDAGNMVLVEM